MTICDLRLVALGSDHWIKGLIRVKTVHLFICHLFTFVPILPHVHPAFQFPNRLVLIQWAKSLLILLQK